MKNKAGVGTFKLSVKRWIEKTNAKGIYAKAGRYGGTYAHIDIALEFASWISPEFKLCLIKDFRRLKGEESKNKSQEWNIKRTLTKINYRIHTDAIKQNLIPPKISNQQARFIYSDEADILNVALFGKTAKEWRDENSNKKGNMRDYADVTQLVCLANLENLNAHFIKQNISQDKRLIELNDIAISQMAILLTDSSIKKLN
jgi:hypothetical protein